MTRLTVEVLPGAPVSEGSFEIVERKGVGHPDSMCDAVMDEAAGRRPGAHRDR